MMTVATRETMQARCFIASLRSLDPSKGRDHGVISRSTNFV